MNRLKEQESHFDFGENWGRYTGIIDESRIEEAVGALQRLFPDDELRGKSFLDIGCGSGIHSLAASRLGASRIEAIDIDPRSVEAASCLFKQHAEGREIAVRVGSVFNLKHSELIGEFDVVYSWGVLHHTGAMEEAISVASTLVKKDGLFAFALYRKTWLCPFWVREKRWYSRSSKSKQKLAFSAFILLHRIFLAIQGTNLNDYVYKYQNMNRGMDYFIDVHDWLGGYPYESLRPSDVDRLLEHLGFKREKFFPIIEPEKETIFSKSGILGSGNDEYVYRKS